jgi:hypothetical protein
MGVSRVKMKVKVDGVLRLLGAMLMSVERI